MSKLLSVAAIALGAVLIYMGYERQQSVAGKTAESLSTLGQKIDGSYHMTTQTKYYVCGTVLLVGGAFALGIVKK
jgi:hypothetical protein